MRPVTGSEAPLLDATLELLAAHPATRTIAESLQHPGYNRPLAEWVCQLTHQLCDERGVTYESAVADFADGCAEFLRLQRRLERTGRYAAVSFEQARHAVYDNPQVMETYLHTLVLSQALWRNHVRVLDAFRSGFCANLPLTGRALEVPVGCGLYLAEFARRNPAWHAVGIDLSASAVAFSRRLVRLAGAAHVKIRQHDVFALDDSHPYDRVICGELLEHLEVPEALLAKLRELLAPDGRLFLTTAIWAANPDHIYLFESADDVRRMIGRWFTLVEEWVLPLEADASPEQRRIPINYACVLAHRDITP